MAWTKAQESAIYTRGTNIIVSAGAGSGKTAVLSERILDFCLKGNDIRYVLVLTFTNAAALEMKERIRKKLLENNLTEQAILIDSADITTFDAYSLGLVKKYFYLLGLDKDLSIIDKSLLEIHKSEILDEMFLELYNNKDERFFSLLRKYTTQKDDDLKEIIDNLSKKLELIVDEDFVNNYESNYYSNEFVDSLVSKFERIVLRKKNELFKEIEELSNLSALDPASVKIYDNAVEAINILKECNSYDELKCNIDRVILGRLTAKNEEYVKVQKHICDEILKDLKDNYLKKYLFLNDAKEEILLIKNDVLFLLELADNLNKKLLEYKYKIMCFDYVDIAKIAINLLKNNPEVKDEIKYKLKEILIDEYQDTSDIQDVFVSLIENNNCYMVGDIKQSIYRFRNANPTIFKNKYDKYSKGDNGVKIDLTHNFRSRKEVLNNINLIFNSLMTNEFGDADYVTEHQMNYGQVNYELLNQDYNFDMEILSYESVEDLKDVEYEAFIAGHKIKEIMSLNNQRLVGNKFVPVKYNDFAILIEKSKSFTTFKKVFEYLGIPLAIEGNLDLKDSIFLKLFSNILCLISNNLKRDYNKKYYHALASVARSFLFEYDDNTVFMLVKNGLKNELTDIIDELSIKSKSVNLVDLYFEIIDKFNIYEKLPLIGDVDNSHIVIEYIYNIFKSIESINMTIEEASVYLNKIFEQNIKLDYKSSEQSEDSVRIMTIHNSKGLEYPYCIFPMLDDNFNQADKKETSGFSRKFGVYIPYTDEAKSNTIIKTLVEEDINQADISEKIRLFYVALTRAREKMIIISNNKEYNQNKLKPESFTCFNHMIRSFDFLNEYMVDINEDDIKYTKDYMIKKQNIKLNDVTPIVYKNNSFISEELGKTRISKEMKELKDDSLNHIINLGNELHACLEAINFNDINVDELDVSNDKKDIIKELLKHDIFKNIGKAKTYHEHEFYYNEYHGIIDLLCVYDDHIDIIDYKLSDINKEEYVRQLSIYKEYVSSISSLPINCYLLSILRKEIKQVN